jgi:hypothetical protein
MPGLDTSVLTGTRREPMSLPEGRLTRRQILSGAAALPVLALAQKTLAQTPSPTATPTVAGGAPSPTIAPIPEEQLEWVLDDAEDKHKVDREAYKRAAVTLWYYFALGVDSEGGGEVTIPPENEILKNAYIYKSGKAVADNLKVGKYPTHGNHGETNVCAYKCGVHAAIAAKYHNSKMIDRDIYVNAWEVTYDETKSRLANAGGLNTGSGPRPLPWGGGC